MRKSFFEIIKLSYKESTRVLFNCIHLILSLKTSSALLILLLIISDAGINAFTSPMPAEIQMIIDYIKNPTVFTKLSIKLPRGICLIGRPGTGKTRLARTLSYELGDSSFTYVKAQDITPNSIHSILSDVRWKADRNASQKAVLFIDDFSLAGGQSITNPAINTLMNELDGFKINDSLIVIIACHSEDNFDSPFIRSGRFDHVVELELPTLNERIEILKEFDTASRIKCNASVDLKKIAAMSYNFTYADLKMLYTNAQIGAQRDKAANISSKHLIEGVVDVLKNQERLDKSLHVRIKVILDLLNKNKQEKKGFARLVGSVPDEVKELIDHIKENKKFKRFNLSIPKGILLSGPPGTGKTTLVRAVSEEAGCEFMALSASEFVDSLVGGGAQKIRDAFKEARQKALLSESGKTILFLDEIDVLGKRQGNALDSTITELLTQMDGFEEDDSIIVVAATNHPENIDAALLRPGRFSKVIKIELPDLQKRKLLLDHYTQGIPLALDVDKDKIATAAHNYSPADLKELVQKAGSLALKESVKEIQEKHFIDAMKKILNERRIKGEKDVELQLNALDVVFNGKSTTKGFNRLVGPIDAPIKDLVDMLSGAVNYAHFGLTFPKGILLVGPPGSGKTVLASTIAEQAGCEFIQAKGSEFIERFVGVGAQRVRDLFDRARTKAQGNSLGKTIIFIDELDAIGSRENPDSTGETKQTLTELLTQMDGFYNDDSIIVIAATNIPSALDPALTRAGRFDTIIEIPLPDLAKRQALFKHYGKNRPLDTTISFADLAVATHGCNVADIKNIVNKAAQHAMRLRAQKITQAHFNLALADIQTAENQKHKSFNQ